MSLLPAPAFPADFGLLLGSSGEYLSDTAGDGPGFSQTLGPWLSALITDNTSLSLAGKLTFAYRHDREEWLNPPPAEIERAELNFRPLPRLYLGLGRQTFRDPAGMIASGSFDGLSGSLGLGPARLSGGLFYTGLIYKESAKILMSRGDREAYARPLDYGEPGTYGASRRLAGTLGAEFPGLSSRTSLDLLFLAQFDLNGYDEGEYHSQYLEAWYRVEARESLEFYLTGIGSLNQGEGAGGSLAWAFGLDWELPGGLRDMAQGELRWGSGRHGEGLGPFTGLNAISRGRVFTPTLGGMTDIRGLYTVRAGEKVSVFLGTGLFVRNDAETFYEGELDRDSGEGYLGAEFYGGFIWGPQSALRFNGEWGVFIPGGAFKEGTEPRWKLGGGVVVSL
jgi:hypothetical protein